MSSPSGLLYAAIIGMWAVVLVPMWLRRHDEAQESKSADRFARAMGTLRRGDSGASGHREVLMPRRPSSVRDTQVVVTGPRGTRTPAAAAAERRRRVLSVLGVLLVLWLVLALAHRIPRTSVVVPVLLVIGFLAVARRQVALAADLRRRQARRATLAEAARAAEARYGVAESSARRGGRAVAPSPVADSRPVERGAVAEAPAERRAAGESWHAVPTTLPTYVTAPRATKVPRVIDLTTPGSWSGAAMVEQARETLAIEPVADGEMVVGTFEIAVPRDPAVRAGVMVEPSTYADRFVEDDVEVAALAAEDDLEELLADPRTGVHGATWRRAANG